MLQGIFRRLPAILSARCRSNHYGYEIVLRQVEEHPLQGRHDPLPGTPIPQGRDAAGGPVAGKQPVQGRGQLGGIGADEGIGADGHRLRALVGVTQGQARYAEHRGLLGDTAGVGDHGLGVLDQVVELQIGLGLDQQDVGEVG